jgi:SNF2 family DNA or RNA helicase
MHYTLKTLNPILKNPIIIMNSTTVAVVEPNKTTIEKFTQLLEKSGYNLKQYQYEGTEWCVNKEAEGIGGIYADEMGLGKTFTMIATIFINFKRRTLIVLPPVLIEQWAQEIFKCTGHKPLIFHGPQKKTITQEQLEEVPIVLTTYSMLAPRHRCDPIGKTMLHAVKWSRIIFDEAHHLRNNKTSRFKSCFALRAAIRWLVTGTPIQNRRSDLNSLCKIIGLKQEFYSDPDNIEIIKSQYMLRRTKEQVGIMLPPVINFLETVQWKNANEKMLSEEIHSLLPNQTNVSTNNINGYLANRMNSKGQLLAILKARQSCILPALIKIPPFNEEMTQGFSEEKTQGFNVLDVKDKEYNEVNEEYDEEYDEETDDEEYDEEDLKSYNEGASYSSKLDAVIDRILERKDNGNGKIIFCHFKDEIDFIAQKLRQGGLKKVIIYDGRNSKSGIKTLSEAADAIVIQIQTGCEGLNLQKNFSEIYFVSPHWNPSVEDQAVARCHRIGQTKPTNVFKFEMSGFDKDDTQDDEHQPKTLENYVNKVQNDKRLLYL